MIETNHMESLDDLELEQASGGIPPAVAIAAAFVARRYGPQIIAGAAGFVAGWLSE